MVIDGAADSRASQLALFLHKAHFHKLKPNSFELSISSQFEPLRHESLGIILWLELSICLCNFYTAVMYIPLEQLGRLIRSSVEM